MKSHEFTLILDREPSEDEVEQLYGMFNDGSISTSVGVPQISFDREAPSLEEAIRSALAEVRSSGFNPLRIEFAPDALAPLA